MMDLWIRSQDREMFRINPELEIHKDNDEKFLILDTKGSTDYYIAKILGEYKTRDRALEILDDIQRWISGEIITKRLNQTNGNMLNIFPTIVYDMPKE